MAWDSLDEGRYVQLAILDNYHLPRKNASFRLVILHGHLWGGRFQMAVKWGAPGDRWKWQGAIRPRRIDMHVIDIAILDTFA